MNSVIFTGASILFIIFILSGLFTVRHYKKKLKKTIDDLNVTEHKDRLILSNINSCLLCVDRRLRTIWSHNFHFLNYDSDLENFSYKKGELFCKNPNKKCELCKNGCLVRKVINTRSPQKDLVMLSSGDCYDVYANPILDARGDVEMVVLKADNITSYHKLFTELNKKEIESESNDYLYSSVFDFIPGILTVKSVDDGMKYVKTNKLFFELFNFTPEEVYGKNDFELFPEDLAIKIRTLDNMVLKSDPNITHVYPVAEFKEIFWSSYRRLVTTSNGESFIISVGHDLTQLHQANLELEKAKHKAVESDKLKSLFLANMSHEIRTPLNAIVGFSELLQYTDNKAEKEKYNKLINYNNELLLRQIDDILIFSQLESGVFPLRRQLFDLSEFFVTSFQELSHHNNNPDVSLVLKNPYRKCHVTLDRHCVFVLLSNFTINAIKNTRKGKIELGYEYFEGGIKVYVSDTGVGIPDNKRDKIFNRFEKLDEFAEGTGLGLAICKSIIAASNGRIGFESQEGVGSTFWAWVKCTPEIEQ